MTTPPPAGASIEELRAYYESQRKPKVYTEAEKALLADHLCIECGQPAEERTVAAGEPPAWKDRCQSCLAERAKKRTRYDSHTHQGAGASSVQREYHRRLGYGSGEPR